MKIGEIISGLDAVLTDEAGRALPAEMQATARLRESLIASNPEATANAVELIRSLRRGERIVFPPREPDLLGRLHRLAEAAAALLPESGKGGDA